MIRLVPYLITLLNAIVVDPLLIHLRLQQSLQEAVVKMSSDVVTRCNQFDNKDDISFKYKMSSDDFSNVIDLF